MSAKNTILSVFPVWVCKYYPLYVYRRIIAVNNTKGEIRNILLLIQQEHNRRNPYASITYIAFSFKNITYSLDLKVDVPESYICRHVANPEILAAIKTFVEKNENLFKKIKKLKFELSLIMADAKKYNNDSLFYALIPKEDQAEVYYAMSQLASNALLADADPTYPAYMRAPVDIEAMQYLVELQTKYAPFFERLKAEAFLSKMLD